MKKDLMPHTDLGLPSFSHLPLLEPYIPEGPNPLLNTLKNTDSGDATYDDHPLTLFDLSSHKRARDAIEFGLSMRSKGFHVFVLGEDRSGRMTSTMTYLKQYVKNLPAPKDWVYLNNFTHAHQPLPFSFPAGQAVHFKNKLEEFMENVHILLTKTFTNTVYLQQLNSIQDHIQHQINQQIEETQNFASENGYVILQSDDGYSIEQLAEEKGNKRLLKKKNKNGENSPTAPTEKEPLDLKQPIIQAIRERLGKIEHLALEASHGITQKIQHLSRSLAKKKLAPLFQRFSMEFTETLGKWPDSLKTDILNNIASFTSITGEASTTDESSESPFYKSERYRVNILVDNQNTQHARIILEPNPGYEQLFGSIKYQINGNGAPETNFTMIRKGALHEANNGILVLRADALAKNPDVWEMLKGALRDHEIRIEERYRDNAIPLLDAPMPMPIPLDVQVFLIASPYWYYTFFYNDSEFRSYFKIKADIEEDMPASAENIQTYRQLLRHNAVKLTGKDIDQDALDFLISCSARWAENRERLSAKFEQIADVLHEAFMLTQDHPTITKQAVRHALHLRRVRNARTEDKSFEEIETGQILIDTKGSSIGQINGLSVISTGDHHFGLPTRISARSYCGEMGVLNIERMTDMAGPIQQKGTMILEGFLNGFLAQRFPLSYSCSLTFEQSYVDVDGDSASMAEVIAILSSLSGIPVRQDLAITGSMNQFGIAQPIGGAHFKVEGFYRVCKAKGLTGTQGVILPRSNLINLTLRDEITQDILDHKFFIWPVDTVFEAIELMLGTAVGVPYGAKGSSSPSYPFFTFKRNSVFYKAEKNLRRYNASALQGDHRRRFSSKE